VSNDEGVTRRRPVMRALLRLYPKAWRNRYEDEFEALIEASPMGFSLIVDVVAGAVAARLNPGLVTRPASAPAASKGEGHMLGRVMKIRCLGYAPHISTRDQWLSAAVMIGGTIVLTLIWMRAHVVLGDNPYTDSLGTMPFLAAYLLSLPFTYLKGRSARAQGVFIGASLALLTAFLLAIGYVASLI
jgi:hypothetical protein